MATRKPKLLSASWGRRPAGRSPTWPRRCPALLDGLTETSVCRKEANEHAEILFRKHGGTGPGAATPDGQLERIAKAEADPASLRANNRVDELYEAMAKGDTARGCELLRDPETHAAYRARLAGERYAAPVEVAKAEPDHRAEIRELLAAGDADGLTRLFRSAPAAHGQYRGMLGTEEMRAAAMEGVAKRRR